VIFYLKQNFQLYILFLIWLVTGTYGGPLIFLVLPASLWLLKRNNKDSALFIGFWFILILSDNLTYPWQFAKQTKDIYSVILAAFFFLDMKSFSPINGLFKKFTPYFIIAIIALLNSETLLVSVQKTISYILLFITVPNYFMKIYREEGDAFLKDLIYFILVILLVCTALRVLDPANAASHGGRLRGLFGNPNGLGLFALLTFLFSFLVIHFRPDLFSKRDKLIIYVLIIIPLLLSGSRNVALALALFYVLSTFYKMSPFLGFIIFLIFLLLYEIIGSNYILIIKTLGLESFFRLETLQMGGGRFVAWKFAWEQIQYNFFLGKGIAFDEYIMRKNYHMLSALGHEGGVHNSYLIIWLNTGLIGLLAYFYSFILVFIQGAKRSALSFPIMFAVMFTINFEPWVAASLNPLTIILLMMITMLTDPGFEKQVEVVPIPVPVVNEEKV
jgi:O-antigen ligase